jgi:hypothetical protein
VLCIAFLAPLYHSHDHAGDYYQENGNDHALLHDVSAHEDLSTSEQHNGSHLHIKKDIGRTDTRLHLNGKSLNPDLCTLTVSPVFAERLTCRRAKNTQAFAFRNNACSYHSGLSPPTA